MTKIEVVTWVINQCGECTHAGHKCDLTGKKIPDMWGKIPKWCPLPDKTSPLIPSGNIDDYFTITNKSEDKKED